MTAAGTEFDSLMKSLAPWGNLHGIETLDPQSHAEL